MTTNDFLDLYYEKYAYYCKRADKKLVEPLKEFLENFTTEPRGSYTITVFSRELGRPEPEDEYYYYYIYSNDCSELKYGYNSKTKEYDNINLGNIDTYRHGDDLCDYIRTIQEIACGLDEFVDGMECEGLDIDIDQLEIEF